MIGEMEPTTIRRLRDAVRHHEQNVGCLKLQKNFHLRNGNTFMAEQFEKDRISYAKIGLKNARRELMRFLDCC